jgi:2-keto-4-pentenoate hydratase
MIHRDGLWCRRSQLEVGLRLVADMPSDLITLSVADFSGLVEPVAVIELVDTRISGPKANGHIVKLADNQINAGPVVGETSTARSGEDIAAIDGRMTAGDSLVLDGATTVPGGSALAPYAALARHIEGHCGGLRRGQIVITGSLYPLVYFPKETQVQGEISGFGSVSVRLE